MPARTPSSAGDAAPAQQDPTPLALRQLALVGLTLLGAVALTYAVPGLERLRPWVEGDPMPFAAIAERWGQGIPAFAGAGSGYQATQRVDEERAAEQLGGSVASNLAESSRPQRTKRASGGGSSSGESPGRAPPAVRIDPDEYDDIDVGIEDPTGRGMRPLYEALLRTARGRDGALTRVGHYGDSSIAADMITRTVRRRMQQRFGDGGHGFILVSRGNMHYGHEDVHHYASGSWKLGHIVRKQLGGDARYGYGGVQYRGTPGARAVFGPDPEAEVGQKVSRFEMFYQKGPRGGSLRLQAGEQEPATLDTRAEQVEDDYHAIELSEGEHELAIRVMGGQPILYGVVLEREGPGVVYDSLGLVGARASRLLNYDGDHIRGQIAHRGLDLLVLGFGGNEAGAKVSQLEDYEREYAEVIRKMRGERDDIGCLVFAPLDQAQKNERGRIATMPSVPHIVEAQRAAARQEGCAFYDTFEAMGGEGAMLRWYRSRPRLATGDFRHATPAGYRVIGTMFYKALLRGFAGYLEQRRNDD